MAPTPDSVGGSNHTLLPNQSQPMVQLAATGGTPADSPREEPWSESFPPEESQDEMANLVHKVTVPPPRSLWSELRELGQKLLFSDEPLRRFRGVKSRRGQAWQVLCGVFPILEWGRKYQLKWLKGDIIAGLTIASIAVPQDLGYAGLAGLPPIYGLYSSFVPPLVYAAMGSSRHIAIGPVAVVSLLLGSLLRSLNVDFDTEPQRYIDLAITATLFAGIIQAGLGLVRLGFIIDFLSEAAIVGFMAGAAVTIALQQLKGMLGIKNFTTSSDIVSVLESVFTTTDEWSWRTFLIGFSFLVFLIFCKELGARNKKYFLFSAASPLTALILSTLIVFVTKVNEQGVRIVGKIPEGVNPPSLENLTRGINRDGSGALKAGIVSGLVALTEAVAIGRTFASKEGYYLDGSMEMLALGTSNIAGALSSCYVATGSFSRSAVNHQAGCTTAVSNIVMSLVILFTLVVLTPLFKYTPNAILSAIIINAVRGLIEISKAKLIWKIDKIDFLATLGAFFGTLFVSVEIGLVVAVAISAIKVLLHITRPHVPVLGRLPGTDVFRNIKQYPNARTIPRIGVNRIDAEMYFANSSYIRQSVLHFVEDEELRLQEEPNARPMRFLILEMTPVTEIDTTGISALEELHKSLQEKKIQLAFANPGCRVMEKLGQAGLVEHIGQEWFFLSIVGAVATCKSLLQEEDRSPEFAGGAAETLLPV